MKDIALCIAGQPRFYNGTGYDSLVKYIIEPYQPDVFFHTWWSADDVGKNYVAAPWSGVENSPENNVQKNALRDLLELYQPVGFEAEPIRQFTLPRDYSGNTTHKTFSPPNLFSWTYSNKRVALLKQNHERRCGKKYRFVIRARFDGIFLNFLDLTKLSNEFVYVPDVCPNPQLLADPITVSNSTDHDLIAELYEKLDLYFTRGIVMNAEHMFTAHLIATGLAPRVRKVPVKYDICRAWPNVSPMNSDGATEKN